MMFPIVLTLNSTRPIYLSGIHLTWSMSKWRIGWRGCLELQKYYLFIVTIVANKQHWTIMEEKYHKHVLLSMLPYMGCEVLASLELAIFVLVFVYSLHNPQCPLLSLVVAVKFSHIYGAFQSNDLKGNKTHIFEWSSYNT